MLGRQPDELKSKESEPELRTIAGKDLSTTDLDLINNFRKEEFGSESIINPNPENEDWGKIYFLLKEGEGLLA